jgi:signal transduction histidine kinase
VVFITVRQLLVHSHSDPLNQYDEQFRAETLRLVTDLARSEVRREAARSLARHLGAEDLMVFIADPELDVLLPAANLPQTLPNGRRWRAFLKECQEARFLHGELPYQTQDNIVPVTGVCGDESSVCVLLGAHSSESTLRDLYLLMPLLSSALAGERAAMTAEAEAQLAESNTAVANSLMASLDSARRELQMHLRESELNQQDRAFLADASARLSSSLDFDETVEQIVQLVIPRLGDYAAIDLFLEDGRLVQVAMAATDPSNRDRAIQIKSDDQFETLDNTPVSDVAATGTTLRYTVTDSPAITTITSNPDKLARLEALNINSVLFVPLIARDQTIGVLQLVHAESRRSHGERDQAVAEDLASRAALAIENARLYRQAQDAGRAREEFLSIASHELKTPLTTIKGYIQMLQRNLDREDISADRIKQTVRQLETQSSRIEALVSDLLDVSRIRQGRLELRPELMDLRETAQRVLARFEEAPERDESHEFMLIADGPVNGEWDPFRIDQVLSNMVSNALKYSTSGGTIRVTVFGNDDFAGFAVQDEGLGISRDGQINLFQPFFRDPKLTVHIGGTGLGLYISRQIVETHGGSIHVESEQDVGSTFTVRLPRSLALDSGNDHAEELVP